MTYATQQDLIDRFGSDEILQLTDRSDLGAINATAVARALTDADAKINAYLEPVYSLPLATVPPLLVSMAADIARYVLYDVRPNEQVRQRYVDAIAFLVGVSTGKQSLGIDSANQTEPVSGGVKNMAVSRTFTPGNLADY